MSIIDEYLQYTDCTEPCKSYSRWAFLAAVGAHLGRDIYLPFGAGHIYPNMYVLLMGAAGDRKSTAINTLEKFVPKTGFSNFAPSRATREAFLIDLEGRPEDYAGVGDIEMDDSYDADAPRERFIIADEFIEFIGLKNINFINTLGTLWDWDKEQPFTDKVKNTRSVSIRSPTISLLGGMTPDHFAMAFPTEILSQGFFSRILLIYGEPTGKKFTIPKPLDAKVAMDIADKLVAIKNKSFGTISVSQAAMDILDYIYVNGEDYAIEDIRFSRYSTRRFTHLLKLCLVHTALDGTKTMQPEHVVMANTELTYAEHFMPRALGEFGKAKNSDVANNIMNLIHAASGPVTYEKVCAAVSHDVSDITEVAKIITTLESAKKIQTKRDAQNRICFIPVVVRPKGNHKYVDYSLLTAEEQEKLK